MREARCLYPVKGHGGVKGKEYGTKEVRQARQKKGEICNKGQGEVRRSQREQAESDPAGLPSSADGKHKVSAQWLRSPVTVLPPCSQAPRHPSWH